jgi:8-oxo-dGTP diphosphatase
MQARVSKDQKVQNLEPHKMEEWRWFDLTNLPDNLFLPLRQLLSGKAYGLTSDICNNHSKKS